MLDIKEVEIYVRTKLGQNIVNPQYDEDKRPIHKKINFGDDGNLGDTVMKHNKKISELFKNDFKRTAIVIYTYKGQCSCYLVTKYNYKEYNYFTRDALIDGMNDCLKLPFFYKEFFGDGTVDTLTNILIKCNELETKGINK